MSDDVRAVLERAADVYARCSTYRDSGEVVSVMIQEEPMPRRRTHIRSFKTRFVRPDKFLFEFREHTVGPESEWERYVVSRLNGVVRRAWSVTCEDGPVESLSRALAGATGVSGGAAHTVPSLLLPNDVPGRDLVSDHPWEIDGEEIVEGEACARLRTKRHAREETLWIGLGTWLIRRVFHRTHFDVALQREIRESSRQILERAGRRVDDSDMPISREYWSESTTTYRAELDCVIDEAEFV